MVATVRESRATLERDQPSLSQTKTSLLSDLRKAFADALYAQENVKLTDKIERRLKKNANFLKLRYQGGLEAKWTYEKAQADWKEALWEYEKAMARSEERRVGKEC